MSVSKTEPLVHGRIGVGSKGTDVRFRNLRITDENGKEIWKGPPKLPAERGDSSMNGSKADGSEADRAAHSKIACNR